MLAQQPAAAPTPAPEAGAPATATTTTRLPDQVSDRFEQVTANQWRLIGNVELAIPGATFKFFADEVDYYLDTSRLVARGNVVFSDADGRIAADQVDFNAATGTGTFKDASGSMRIGSGVNLSDFAGQDPDVYFYGETIEKLGPRRYRLTGGAFTTCVQPTPRWEVTSKTVTINLEDYAYARNTLLKVKGVPVLYLPAIYYPIQGDDRATGFLLPSYGTSTLRGQAITNGFFWAIDRSQDATFVHDWYTQAGWGTGGEYRYVASDQSQGNVRLYGFSRNETTFTEDGVTSVLPASNSFQITGTANQSLSTRLRARGYVDYFSDIVTQHLYNQNIYQATQSRRTIEGSLSGSFGVTSMSAHFQRNEYLTDATSSTIYGSTPRVSVNVAPQMLFGTLIYASVDTEFARIPNREIRDGVVTSDRTLNQADLAPMLRIPLSRLTYLSANATASYHTTYYSRSLDEDGDLTDAALTRQFMSLRSEFIGPVLTKIWDTPTSASTERMKHVIEPTVHRRLHHRDRQPGVGADHQRRLRLRGGRGDATDLRPYQPTVLPVAARRGRTQPDPGVPDHRRQPDLLHQPPVEPVRHELCQLLAAAEGGGAVADRPRDEVLADAVARHHGARRIRRVGLRFADLHPRRDNERRADVGQHQLQPAASEPALDRQQLRLRVDLAAAQGRQGHRHVRAELGRRARVRGQPDHGVVVHGAVLRLPGRGAGLQLSGQRGRPDPGGPPVQRVRGAGGARQHLQLLRRDLRRAVR